MAEQITVTRGERYRVESKRLAAKYGTDAPVIRIEKRWAEFGGPRFIDAPQIGCVYQRPRIASEVGATACLDDANLWYGKIDGLGEVVHTSELRPLAAAPLTEKPNE